MSNITIPIELQKVLTADGFYIRWQHHTQSCKTYVEAYYKTEEEVYKYFATNKYSSYNSFINSKNKRK